MKNKKKLLIISTIILLTILVTTIVLALFTSKQEDEGKIYVGNLEVILREDWEDIDVPETGIEQYSKTVWGESVAEKKAYVRMRFIPVVEYYMEEENGIAVNEWRTAPVSYENIELTVDTKDKWIKQGDYYYYKDILEAREATNEIDLSWKIVELPSALSAYDKIRTDVRVILEYSQISNDVWKDVFQIDNLPEGVEK